MGKRYLTFVGLFGMAFMAGRCVLVSAFLCAVVPGQATASVTFTENFDNGVLDPNLEVWPGPAGFNVTLSGGKAVFQKASGIGNGFVQVHTRFRVLGDFTATVEMDRTLAPSSSSGIATWHSLPEAWDFTDVYFHSLDRIIANIFVNPGFGNSLVYNSTRTANFRIRRVGMTIFEEFKTGAEFEILHQTTHPNLTGPVSISIFLGEEIGDTGALQVTADNLTIVADGFQELDSYACVPPPSGLISWWPGEGNANDTVDGNDGTLLNGASFATGKVGQAFSFDGVNDYVTIPFNSNLAFYGIQSFTLDAWIKTPNPYKVMLIAGEPYGAQIHTLTNGGVRFGWSVSGDSAATGNEPGNSISPNTWVHVAAVYDSATQQGSIYINGVLVTGPTTGLIWGRTSLYEPFQIGAFGPPSSVPLMSPFEGQIDELDVFNRALSASEIQAIFNAGSAGKCPPPSNTAPVADAGPDVDQQCDGVDLKQATASDPDNDPLTYHWTSSCPNTVFDPSPDVLNPKVRLGASCNVSCVLTLTVSDGKGGQATDEVNITINDTTPPRFGVANASQPSVTLDIYAWYTVDSLSGLSDGAPVTAWTNNTGDVSFDLAPVGLNFPTYLATGLNGQPCVHFNFDTPMGTAKNIGLSGDPSFTVFFAGRIRTLAGTFTHPWVWGDGSGETGYPGGASDFEIQDLRVDYATGYSQDANTPEGSFNGLIGMPVVVAFARSPGPLNATTRIWINGASQLITGSNLPPNIVDTPFYLGPTYAQHGAQSPVMDVVDVLIYNRSLSDAEVAEVNNWLAVKNSTATELTGCPEDATVQCLSEVLPVPTVTAKDNCDGDVSVVFSETQSNPNSNCNNTITRTWTATDSCGNSTHCVQVFTVKDTDPPLFDPDSIPANLTVECDSVPAPAEPKATDNCGGPVTITFSESRTDGSCAQSYTLTRTWTATDACGNTATANQVIIVHDTKSPVITCPPDVVLECPADTSPDSTGKPRAIDNCGQVTITYQDEVTPGCGQTMTIVRTWTATDDCGNEASCEQTIVVEDTTPPRLTICPPNAELMCKDAVPAADPKVVAAVDNCDAEVTIEWVDDTDNGGKGCANDPLVITRTYRATDDCGNSTDCVQVFTIKDTDPPLFDPLTIPGNLTVECDSVPPPAQPQATDNCGGPVTITFTETRTDGSCPASYTLTRTWTATDTCGNTATANQVIIVHDTKSPVITCPPDVVLECPADTSPDSTGKPTAIDNCGQVTITYQDEVTPGCGQTMTIVRTWTAEDECGNKATCKQKIVVQDTTLPVITCPEDKVLECPPDTSPESTGKATATDNCGEVTITYQDTITPGCGHTMTIVRTWTATDDCGNEASCDQNIVVQDKTQPELKGVPGNVTVECDAVPTPPEVTATDNCDDDVPVVFEETRTDGDCPQSYVLTRTWTATDNCRNSTSATQTITLQDTTAPKVTLTTAVKNLWPPDHDLVDVGLGLWFSDNCDANPSVQLSVTQDEPVEDETGDGNFSPDAKITAVNGKLVLRLRSERKGNGDGRVYLIIATVTDASGNVTKKAVAVTVPKSQSKKDLDAVAAQAAAAVAAGAPLPYDSTAGPVIGPKQ